MEEATRKLSKMGVNVFVLPGGYLYSAGSSDLSRLREKIKKTVHDSGVDLVVGVDTSKKQKGSKWIEQGPFNSLSIFISKQGDANFWYQRSSNNDDQKIVTDDICQQERLIWSVPKTEVLICGELFNSRIKKSIIKRNTAIVINQVHEIYRYRFFWSMRELAKNKTVSMISAHADKRGAMKQCYIPKRSSYERMSSNETDYCIGEEPRIEIKVWEFDNIGQLIRA